MGLASHRLFEQHMLLRSKCLQRQDPVRGWSGADVDDVTVHERVGEACEVCDRASFRTNRLALVETPCAQLRV
jgi:hypothetical protein